MTLLIFIIAMAAGIVTFEILSAVQGGVFGRAGARRLDGATITDDSVQAPKRRSTWDAVLVALFPSRFDITQAKDSANVIALIRRSGYYYDTPGDFYAAAIRDFTQYLIVAALGAAALAMFGYPFIAPFLAGFYLYMGLTRPYARLKKAAKKRAEGMKNNMLIGLALLESLLAVSVNLQEALRTTSKIGGPFCNLLGLLISQIESRGSGEISAAIAVTKAHLPDPNDIEANLFFQDIEDHFLKARPILTSVRAMRQSVHRNVIDETETRAALVKQRSGLFGVFAVVGLILAIILPYMGAI